MILDTAADTYKDLPFPSRPSKWIWNTWIYGLWALVLVFTLLSGLPTAIDIFQVLPVGLLWGIPCVPRLSSSNKLILAKPKALVGALSILKPATSAQLCPALRSKITRCGNVYVQRVCRRKYELLLSKTRISM